MSSLSLEGVSKEDRSSLGRISETIRISKGPQVTFGKEKTGCL